MYSRSQSPDKIHARYKKGEEFKQQPEVWQLSELLN